MSNNSTPNTVIDIKSNGALFFEMQYKDSDSNPIDITGQVIKADINLLSDNSTVAQFSIGSGLEYTDAANGKFALSIADINAYPVTMLVFDVVINDGTLNNVTVDVGIDNNQGRTITT